MRSSSGLDNRSLRAVSLPLNAPPPDSRADRPYPRPIRCGGPARRHVTSVAGASAISPGRTPPVITRSTRMTRPARSRGGAARRAACGNRASRRATPMVNRRHRRPSSIATARWTVPTASARCPPPASIPRQRHARQPRPALETPCATCVVRGETAFSVSAALYQRDHARAGGLERAWPDMMVPRQVF